MMPAMLSRGVYINPGNQAFAEIAGKAYVDKTGLISQMNGRIGGSHKLVCISRPRRFGKSYAAKMLTAYYDCTCDSHALFDDRAISGFPGYADHLNRYNVINLDITAFISEAVARHQSLRDIPEMIQQALRRDLKQAGAAFTEGDSLSDVLIRCAEPLSDRKFIFIIDEWDSIFRIKK